MEIREIPLHIKAGAAGYAYLLYLIVTILSDRLSHLGMGSADQITRTILSSPTLFRLGLAGTFVSVVIFLITAWLLYAILKPAGQVPAALFLLLNAVGAAIHASSLYPLYLLLENSPTGFPLISFYKSGYVCAQLFYGTWLFPLGYLVYKSGFLPRLSGILLILDGVGILIWFFQFFLLPGLKQIIYPGLVISFIAEASLSIFLVLKGFGIRGRR